MPARVFISYRNSDGADKATALARDLASRFGAEQIFLDKDDLAAGSRWRDGIARAIDAAPVLIVLVTPNYLGGRDAAGELCIERADDPVRGELAEALAAGATVIPLLCDGVAAAPPANELPAPFDQLGERHWGKLRAFDWAADLERLTAVLASLGVADIRPATTESAALIDAASAGAAAAGPQRRRLAIGVGAAVVVLGGGSAALWLARAGRDRLSGAWRARVGRRGAETAQGGEPLVVALEQRGDDLVFASHAIDVDRRAEWEGRRAAWRQRTGVELKQVYYRGQGKVEADAGGGAASGRPVAVRRLALAVAVVPPGADAAPIDVGSLRGIVDSDEQRIHAWLWLDSEGAERVVELRRAE